MVARALALGRATVQEWRGRMQERWLVPMGLTRSGLYSSSNGPPRRTIHILHYHRYQGSCEAACGSQTGALTTACRRGPTRSRSTQAKPKPPYFIASRPGCPRPEIREKPPGDGRVFRAAADPNCPAACLPSAANESDTRRGRHAACRPDLVGPRRLAASADRLLRPASSTAPTGCP